MDTDYVVHLLDEVFPHVLVVEVKSGSVIVQGRRDGVLIRIVLGILVVLEFFRGIAIIRIVVKCLRLNTVIVGRKMLSLGHGVVGELGGVGIVIEVLGRVVVVVWRVLISLVGVEALILLRVVEVLLVKIGVGRLILLVVVTEHYFYTI